MRGFIRSFMAVAMLAMASTTWAGLVTFPLAVADIEIDDTLPPNEGLLLNTVLNTSTQENITVVNRTVPQSETPSAILLSQFLADISYGAFFDPATVAGQTIPGAFGLERFFLGFMSSTVTEVFGARTSTAVIITDDLVAPNTISGLNTATVLEGTLQFDDITTVTDTNFFLDVNTIPETVSVPEPTTLGLLGLGLLCLELSRRRRK